MDMQLGTPMQPFLVEGRHRNAFAIIATLSLGAFLAGGWLAAMVPLAAWKVGRDALHRYRR